MATGTLKDFEIPCLYNPESLKMQCLKLGLYTDMQPCHIGEDTEIGDTRVCHDEYEVEEILDCVQEKGQVWFLVKWKDWEETFNTWEPERNLTRSREAIKTYFDRRKAQHKKCITNDTEKKLLRGYNRQQLREFAKLVLKDDDIATMLKFCGMPYVEFIKSGKTAKQLNKDLRSVVDCFLNKRKIDRKFAAAASKALISRNGFRSEILEFSKLRSAVLERLRKWTNSINAIPGLKVPIAVENDIDLEGPPEVFTYITDYKAGDGIIIPDDPPVGCTCEDCYHEKTSCCPAQFNCEPAYSRHGYIKVPEGTPIYECNVKCCCDEKCVNRVVQKGITVKVAIFRTHDGRGWGVKTLEKIKKGQFVMEYVGEVITTEEADSRGKIYDAEGRTYLFDLDFNEGDHPFTVDAAHLGNVAHFMNHSCNPNLLSYSVWINNLDPRLPRIAFFAKHEIKRGEELTFDYKMKMSGTDGERATMSPHCSSMTPTQCLPSPSTPTCTSELCEELTGENIIRIPCKCGSQICRKYLY